jgi:hypothetical protein
MSIRRWLSREATVWRRTFIPHDGNSQVRKLSTLVLVVVWAVLEIGTTFTQATPPVSMNWIRAVIIAVVFQESGRQRGKLERVGGER